jgi:hypothetical protein
VSRPGDAAGSRCARFLLGVLLLVLSAAGVAACGGSASSDVGPYLGVWQRVEGGTPNPDFTLTVARQSDGALVTFADLANGQDRTGVATPEDGYLALRLPAGDGARPVPSVSPSAGAPLESDLQLSVDENGQLIVDLVLADGTTEPVGIYERMPSVASTPAATQP